VKLATFKADFNSPILKPLNIITYQKLLS